MEPTIGVDVASRFPLQAVAIVLRGRRASEAEYFTERVAAVGALTSRDMRIVPMVHRSARTACHFLRHA